MFPCSQILLNKLKNCTNHMLNKNNSIFVINVVRDIFSFQYWYFVSPLIWSLVSYSYVYFCIKNHLKNVPWGNGVASKILYKLKITNVTIVYSRVEWFSKICTLLQVYLYKLQKKSNRLAFPKCLVIQYKSALL